MIIQTAEGGVPSLAIMMHQHNALCQQFAYAFGNQTFQSLEPLDLMVYVISHHDAGWLEFDRAPAMDEKSGLPYNLADTPPQYITATSRLSPDFNQQHHPYCGLISSMHSWGLYNGRYGLSNLVLLDKILAEDRPITERMLADEINRQEQLKLELAKNTETAAWLDERKLFQNYKQLQFIDTLALYFNRIHPNSRIEQTFEHVPLNCEEDVTVSIRPIETGVYALSPFPFAVEDAEFAFAGHPVSEKRNCSPSELHRSATQWERFRLIAG